MRGKTDDKKEGSTYLTIAWTGVGTPAEKKLTFDPTADAKFPAGMRVVSFRRAAWSDDGKTVTLGIAKWEDKPPPAPGAGRGGRAGGDGANATAPAGEGRRRRTWRARRRAERRAARPGERDGRRHRVALEGRAGRVGPEAVRDSGSPPESARRLAPRQRRRSRRSAAISRRRSRSFRARTGRSSRSGASTRCSGASAGRPPISSLADLDDRRADAAQARPRRQRAGEPRRQVPALRRERRVVDAESRDEGRHQHLEGRRRRASSTRNRTRRSSRSRRSASPAGRSRTRPCC